MISVIFFILSQMALASNFQEPSEDAITKAIETFKFNGEWIHPKLIKEFCPWESDYVIPLINSLDVSAATDTNRYFGKITYLKDDKLKPSFTEENGSIISYEWIGKLKNGMHIILYKESGSGSMVSTNLLVFLLKKGRAKNESGKEYKQLLLEIQRVIVIGDRDIPNINLDKNTIEIKTQFNSPRKPETKLISFD